MSRSKSLSRATLIASSYGSVSGAGWYDSGSSAYAELSVAEVPLGTGVRERFEGWTGDATGSATMSNAIVMEGPKRVSASWSTEYLMTVETDVGTVEGGGWYAAGATASLQAPTQVVQDGQTYNFAGWTGNVRSSEKTLTLTVNRPVSVRATWTAAGPLGISGAGSGLLGVAAVIVLVVALLVSRRRRGRND